MLKVLLYYVCKCFVGADSICTTKHEKKLRVLGFSMSDCSVMVVFDSIFTYQLSQQLRYGENVYCNSPFVSFVCDYYGVDVVNENIRLCHNRHCRSSRVKSRLLRLIVKANLFNDDTYFCTFTLNDRYINLPYLTLRKYFTDFLKSNFLSYIGNVDFGAKNGRLHFHAVVRTRASPPDWKYGFFKYQPLFNDIENCGSCANYINKLSNHSTKVSFKIVTSEDLRK